MAGVFPSFISECCFGGCRSNSCIVRSVFSSTWGLSVMTSAPSIDDVPDTMVVTLAAYGLFMLNWSLLETVIEVAIQKRLELHPLEGTIVTASLGFQARASILRSILSLYNTQEAKDAIKEINTATQEANRNHIIHGQVFAEGETLSFLYRKVDHGLTAKRITVNSTSMLERASKLKDSVIKLQSLLSISDEDLHEFAKIGQIAVVKAETSPKPPSSKTSAL